MKDPRDRRVKRPHLKTGPKPRRGVGELWDLRDRYLEWMRVTGYAEETQHGAGGDLHAMIAFLEHLQINRIADVTMEVLQDFALWLRERRNPKIPTRGFSALHIAHRIIGLRKFFRWLRQNGVILYDPAEDLEIPKLPQSLPRVILAQDEMKRLIETPDLSTPLGYRDRALLETLYATGIRTGELLKLKVGHIDLNENLLMVWQGKGKKDRIVPLPARAAGYLKEYLDKVRPIFAKGLQQDQQYLFLSPNGCRVTAHQLQYCLERAVKAAKIDRPVTALTFRHSIASHLLENGMEIRAIQEFLGHDKLSTTQIYARVTLSGLRKHYNKAHPKEKRIKQAEVRPGAPARPAAPIPALIPAQPAAVPA